MLIKKAVKGLLMNGIVLPLMNQANALESNMLQNEGNIHCVRNSPKRFEVLNELAKLQSSKAQLAGFPRTVPIIISSVIDRL